MRKLITCLFLSCYFFGNVFSQALAWEAKRITCREGSSKANTWIDYRKDLAIKKVPDKAMARIACDSKYWLWINGEMVVFEGQLKRGPTPDDTYYDEINIAPFLSQGHNSIAVLVWYFGKNGFSHNSSGESGLVFECESIGLFSDGSWLARLDPGYGHTSAPHPNFRLPESNVKFDARKGNFGWIRPDAQLQGFMRARVLGEADSAPWNDLIKRPIPFWKDYGEDFYINDDQIPSQGTGDWIICELPYNCHLTPILDIEAPPGKTIQMQTDNYDYMGLNFASVRSEYVTRAGRQRYESFGWQNGHVMKYHIPEGVKIHSLTYRETGYDCGFTGSFHCSDPFFVRLWQKAVRTLYVTMRDTYMDCPDRERAQWWGDVVIEQGEAFYALGPQAIHLARKGILELINWQREDGTIYSPIPSGNWNKELPGQMLASVGIYGFWTYYINTGDKQTIEEVYPGVKRYLDLWKLKPNGTLVKREGDWYWGDWGKQVDRQLLFNAWYYLAMKGYYNMSEVLGEKREMKRTRENMQAFKRSFNKAFWDGKGYRTQTYKGKYDDRGQALAVISGLAEADQYDALLKIFKTSFLASPYMEKYVLEALFIMNEPIYGLERMKKRYHNMVKISPYSTLAENFGDGADGEWNGTNNHAWSGGGLTVLAQYVCGVEPIDPAWKTFRVKPQLGNLDYARIANETLAGKMSVQAEQSETGMTIQVQVPDSCKALVYTPVESKSVVLNGTLIYDKKPITNGKAIFQGIEDAYNTFLVGGGKYEFQIH